MPYTYAGYGLFKDCTSLKSVPNLPATNVQHYGYSHMFDGCTGLTTLPANLLSAATSTAYINTFEYMFANCVNLTNIPNVNFGVGKYGCSFMFKGCSSLTTLPSFASAITQGASGTGEFSRMFTDCTSITACPVMPAAVGTSTCSYMFDNCTSLTSIPSGALPATTLGGSCYYGMFTGCTSLSSLPSNLLPATTLANACYYQMFNGCTSLTSAPSLPATTLAGSCYYQMFYRCTNLATCPALSATTLADNCYLQMFYGCTSITSTPTLPATTLAEGCYRGMFYGCTNLVNTTTLPATTLQTNCYREMFRGCTSLVKAPHLPATTLVGSCYYQMFYGCGSLKLITADFEDWNGTSSSTSYWLYGASSSGTMCLSTKAAYYTYGRGNTDIAPYGWFTGLCFIANTANSTVTLNKTGSPTFSNCQYTTDGITWNSYTPGTTGAITLTNVGDRVWWRSTCDPLVHNTTSKFLYFSMTGSIRSTGLISSMYNGSNNNYRETGVAFNNYACYKMFQNCTALTNPPCITGWHNASASYNFAYAFTGCTGLTSLASFTIPVGSTTANLSPYGFYYMFNGCTGLKLSTTQTGDYQTEYRIPTSGTGTAGTGSLNYMFNGTGGTFKGTPTVNTTYYTSNTIN